MQKKIMNLLIINAYIKDKFEHEFMPFPIISKESTCKLMEILEEMNIEKNKTREQ